MKIVRLITFALVMACCGAWLDSPVTAQTVGAKAKAGKTAAAVADLIDINHATQAELKTLPGIGDAYSAAIIKNRPYKNKTQLRSGGVIPLATYNKISDKIIAKQ